MNKTIAFITVLALSAPVCADVAGTQSRGPDSLLRVIEPVCTAVDQMGVDAPCETLAVERRVLSGNIVEYSFRMPVGSGPYETIGIHRIVREIAPFIPAPTRKALMILNPAVGSNSLVHQPIVPAAVVPGQAN